MFILCPHCQFLVAIDPASGLPPAQCPRCGKALVHPAANAGAPAPVVSRKCSGARAAWIPALIAQARTTASVRVWDRVT